MRFKAVTTILLSLFFLNASAQEENDHIVRDIIESMADNLSEDLDLSELTERLHFYKRHPINLNNTNASQLKELAFLSPVQVSNFFTYLAENGHLLELLELQAIDGFDLPTIAQLLHFVTLVPISGYKNITWNKLFKLSSNELMLRYGNTLEQQKGYISPSKPSASHYLGSKSRMLTRYRFDYQQLIAVTLNIKKDAGEQLWDNQKNLGFDFISGNISFNTIGPIKKIVIGDYGMQFGQGLTLWSGLGFGKGADISSIPKKDMGLKPYTSTNEYSFLRGLATTLGYRNIEFTPFVSYKNLDASFNNEQQIKSISTTGFHRTPTEIKNRSAAHQLIYGGNLRYNYKRIDIGITGYRTQFSHPINKGDALYNGFSFAGQSLSNVGIQYSYTFRNSYFFGETAHSLHSGYATINGLLISLSPKVSALALHRIYNKNYHSFFNQAIAEASEAINEQGFYVGLEIKPNKKFNLSLYADQFQFPWLRYRIDAPSSGYELFGQLTYSPKKTLQLLFRFKTKLKQQNADSSMNIHQLDEVRKNNYRIELNWQLNKKLSFQNRAEAAQYQKGNAQSEYGFLLYQDIDYNHSLSLKGNLRLAYFNTASYNSRIYAYENDVLYGSSFGAYQYKGFRTYLNARYRIKRNIDLWLRYAISLYKNQQTIGSGLDEIQGNHKSDIKMQLRYLF